MDLNQLYAALEEADKKAQAGDAQAKLDAAELASMIQQYKEAPTSEPDYVNPIIPAVATGILAGAKGFTEVIPTSGNIAKAMQQNAPSAPSPKTMYNPRGVSVEQSVDNWRNYSEAQNEAAKGIRRDTSLAKKYPNFQRNPLPITQETADARNLARQKIGAGLEATGKFANRVPGINVAGGALAGYQGADAYNRFQQGDVAGGTVSTLGSGSSAAATMLGKSNPKLRVLGLLGGAVAPLVNRGIDSLREEKAMGGPVGYAGGKAVKGGLEAVKKLLAPSQTKIVRASEALGPHEGKYLNTTQSDRMRSTEGDLGGPGFSKFQLERPEYKDAAWGVGKKSTASGILNTNKRYPEGQSIWSPMIGSEIQHHSNQHVYDALTNEFNRQAAMGKLTPELREEMNARLMNYKEYAPLFKKGVDVGNPQSLAQMGDTFDRRAALSTVLSGKGVGGQKGQIFDYPGIMQDMTDPMTIGAPTHSVGTRLFTLNNQVEYRPDLHSAFPYILKGEDMGVAFNPVPKELAIPDWMGLVRDFKGREPGYMDYTRGLKGKGTPFQFIDENYLRRLEEAGHKEGGPVEEYAAGSTVKKAVQSGLGALKSKEEFKNQFTPGFYHGSPSNKIKEFDSSNIGDSGSVIPGATFVSRNQEFAESFLPMSNKGQYKSGATMYPVSVNLGKHFHPQEELGEKVIREYAGNTPLAQQMSEGNWSMLESPDFMKHLQNKGFDSMTVIEGGVPNVAVFNPKNIRGKFAKYNPEDAESADFMKAEGGPVGYAAGKKVIEAGLNFIKPAVKSHSQDPRVARALEEYLKGNISQEERIRIMNEILPARKWSELPPDYTDEQIRNALMANKQPKALAPVPAGMQVGNRLDIPAYTQNGVYIDTTHDIAGKPISYGRTGHLKDVDFSSKPNQAVRVGLGTKEQALTPMGAEMGSAKSPFALIKGTNQGTSDKEVRRMMAEMMKDPNYTQIGMDPRRHSQFYDKSTGLPVFSAEEKLQSGPLIIAPRKGLETTSWDDPRLNLSDFPGKKYAGGGSSTPAWQRSEGKNPEGGLNAAGRASYNRETGGNLKAPQPEGGSRKKSFCARMSGMKKKLTSSKTANDPDSRINKSLRKWKC